MLTRPRLVLASASPRRAVLLEQAGIVPDEIIAPDINEEALRDELPREYALRMAEAKTIAIGSAQEGAFILAADTVVARGRSIMPKAATNDDVKHCLELLSGRRHRVYTAVAVVAPDDSLRTRTVMTSVMFKRLSSSDVSRYLATGEGVGKAGGYAIQGRAEAFIKFIRGSYSNVVGLSVYDTMQMLKGLGYL